MKIFIIFYFGPFLAHFWNISHIGSYQGIVFSSFFCQIFTIFDDFSRWSVLKHAQIFFSKLSNIMVKIWQKMKKCIVFDLRLQPIFQAISCTIRKRALTITVITPIFIALIVLISLDNRHFHCTN